MNPPRRYWFVLHPDVSRPIGGVKQIHRLAEAIVASGREAILIQDNKDFHPGWFHSTVETISLKDWLQLTDLSPTRDALVLPETFINVISRYTTTLPVIIFNQNGSYSFGTDSISFKLSPQSILKIYFSDVVSHVLCVSSHDYRLLTSGFGLPESKVSLIVNGLENGLFTPIPTKRKQISFMPRKNQLDAQIVCSMLLKQPWMEGWSLKPISGCSQPQVASILQESLLFLSFGHPEGFGLPVAEALSCGCAVVGYSGLGGRELFSIAKKHHVCKEIGFGDWFGFVDATNQFVKGFIARPQWVLSHLKSCSSQIIASYNEETMNQSVFLALSNIENSL